MTNLKKKSKLKTVILVTCICICIVIASVALLVIFEKLEGFIGNHFQEPTILFKIKEDDSNWTATVISVNRVVKGLDNYTFVIRRGNLTLVSFTIMDKGINDPTNIDPLTDNITEYDIYTLSKEGYTIYIYDKKYYDEHNELISGFNAGDLIYIVNNGLRSGDSFEILIYWQGVNVVASSYKLP